MRPGQINNEETKQVSEEDLPHFPPPFTREELQELRARALRQAGPPYMSSSWADAFRRLAEAADILDAFMARAEVKG